MSQFFRKPLETAEKYSEATVENIENLVLRPLSQLAEPARKMSVINKTAVTEKGAAILMETCNEIKGITYPVVAQQTVEAQSEAEYTSSIQP